MWSKYYPPDLLYSMLQRFWFRHKEYETLDLGEGMSVIKYADEHVEQYRFLVDNTAKKAYVFINESCDMPTVYPKDINWQSLPRRINIHQRTLSWLERQCGGLLPTIIHEYHDGVAMVSWNVQPVIEQPYNSDLYTNEITLYGFIDREGRVMVRFRTITDKKFLLRMQRRAKYRHLRMQQYPERYKWRLTKRVRRIRELYESCTEILTDMQGRDVLADGYGDWNI